LDLGTEAHNDSLHSAEKAVVFVEKSVLVADYEAAKIYKVLRVP